MDVLFIILSLLFLILIIGMLLFFELENWFIIDFVYYCFIIFMIIGFGDFVVMQKNNIFQICLGYVFFVLFFILVGLIVIFVVMNLLVFCCLILNSEDEKRDEMEVVEVV